MGRAETLNPFAPNAGPPASAAEWRSQFGAVTSNPLILSFVAVPAVCRPDAELLVPSQSVLLPVKEQEVDCIDG